MQVGFQNVGDPDAMIGSDRGVVVYVAYRVDHHALAGSFRTDYIRVVGEVLNPNCFNEHRSSPDVAPVKVTV